MVQSSVHEKVAKISARQAVAVALISAAAGVAGALISSGTYSTSKQPPVAATQLPVATQPPVATQHYLTIRSVGAGSHTDYVGFRIVVEVNGQAYSYPSRAVWNSFDSDMASEAFPLPLSQHEYWVRFEAFCRTNTDDVTHL